MKIIHYIFGIPPLRGGGTIKYALDLAKEQSRQGHEVFLLYPGEIKKTTVDVGVKRSKSIKGIKVFEIINPLPVPLVSGIKEPLRFVKIADKNVYLRFLEKEKIKILHVHSLMGLHLELLEAAKELNIKILFSTHDYFGICPKTNLLYKNSLCKDIEWINCAECCKDAESVDTLIRRQKHLFQMLIKCKALVKLNQLRKNRFKLEKSKSVVESEFVSSAVLQKEYYCLRKYYEKELQLMDMILFNSSIAKEQYEKRVKIEKSVIVGNMHSGIMDNRKRRNYGSVIRFAYLGYPVDFKGYPLLISVMDKLDDVYPGQFILNTYMKCSTYDKDILERKYIRDHVPYQHKDIEKIYDEMDVLLVPSIWAETYGFVVLEALSYGVPVIITDNVGAKDLLKEAQEFGKVVSAKKEDIYKALEQIICNKNELEIFNRNICDSKMNFCYEKYVADIVNIYKDIQT